MQDTPRQARIRTERGSKRVRVTLGGETLADSANVTLLHEASYPVRAYLPKSDIAMRLLRPSDTRTTCPHKGVATYYSATAGGREVKDVAWCYEGPLPEAAAIRGLLCFYPERVDRIDETPR